MGFTHWFLPLLCPGGGILPISIDFSLYGDGTLPKPIVGPTWTNTGGVATPTVTVGAELLTDPGLEVNYTAGKCDTLVKGGTPTLVQSANVHGGVKAQQFTATAGNDRVNWPVVAGVVNQWYVASEWAVRTVGADGEGRFQIEQAAMKPATLIGHPLIDAAYAQKVTVFRTGSTANIYFWGARDQGAAPWDTVIIDDGSLKAATFTTALFYANAKTPLVQVRVSTHLTGGSVGVFARMDNPANPQNFLLAYLYVHNYNFYAILEKCVAGAYSTVIAGTSIDVFPANYVSGDLLEIRTNGDTVQLWYDGVQRGGDQVVAGLTGTYHGGFAMGGSGIKGFFAVGS